MAREIAMRLAVGNVNAGDLVAAVNLTVNGQKRWHPPRRASDALVLLNVQFGELRCGRVERRAASEALGRVANRHGVGLLKRILCDKV